MKRLCTYNVPLGTDIFGNIQRLDNTIAALPDKLKAAKEQLETTERQLETAKKDVEVPFPHEEDLAKKSARLAELDSLLSLDKPDNEIVDDDRDGDAARILSPTVTMTGFHVFSSLSLIVIFLLYLTSLFFSIP